MEEWLASEASDGFNVMFPYLPEGLDDFVDRVVPELQRRGIFRREYEGKTLRENLGLPRPENRYFRARRRSGGSRRMKFGWMTLAHSPSPEHDASGIFEQLEQATLAEALGFDGVWLTEHNFTGESVYVDPIPFAAALAMRTQRIRIGFAVIQMALRHPVRLATQLSLLDNLTRGRLDIGIGRGSLFNEYEFVGYGLRSDDARERMAEALDVMTRAWTATPLDHKGKYFTVRLPELRPVPVQRPHPPIWHSVASAASFRLCGEKGVPILTARLPLGADRRAPGPIRGRPRAPAGSTARRRSSCCRRRRSGGGSMWERAAPLPRTSLPPPSS